MGKRVGAVITEIRAQRTMREFASLLDVQVSTVSKWESGANRPDGRNAGKLLRQATPDQVEALLQALDEDLGRYEDDILEAGGVKVVKKARRAK